MLLGLLPGGAAAQSGNTHVVQRGETLVSIAAAHGVSATALARANGITNPDMVRIGQKLVIPGGSASAAAPATTPQKSGSTSTYTVKAGQSLGKIAALLGVSSTALAQVNGITNPDMVRVGQKLVVPAGPAVGASQGTTTSSATSATRFVASISAQHCWLYVNGQLVGNWTCSTGRKGSPTVPGTYKIQSKMSRAWGGTWGWWLPAWLGIYYAGKMENGIHGLPYTPAGVRQWEGMIGTPVSYGCVVLADVNAQQLYNVAYVGMPVIIQP